MRPYVVLIPGLRRSENSLFSRFQNKVMRWILWYWWGVQGDIFLFPWLDPKEAFDEEMARLRMKVEQLNSSGHRVVLVGISAGVSVALNLSIACPRVARVVCIDGRVRKGNHAGKESLDYASADYPIFKECVLRCEEGLWILKSDRLATILTLVPFWGKTVPADTAAIKGAQNVKVWCAGHIPSIFAAMVFRRRTILRFIA